MYKRYQLNNGIQVITEKIPYFRSVSIGFWFRVGSVFETKNENGMSHYIEHMLFKGTKTRTAKQIAETVDSVGGQLNAFTAKEYTCFYCKVTDEHVELALHLLRDMIMESTFDVNELEKEKGVILEEIFMYEDSPEDLSHDLLSNACFGSHPLGQPILGTQSNLNRFERNDVLSYYNRYYTPDNLVISVAGNFDDENLEYLINKYFSQWSGSKSGNKEIIENTNIKSDIIFRNKDIEQIHLCIGYPGVTMGSDQVYPLMIFNNIFGGSMSSNLFQRIREDHGLAYSVYSYPSIYTCSGLFTIYAGMNPNQVHEVLRLIMEEINDVSSGSITHEEFNRSKEQLKGNYILGLENTYSRMTAIGKSQLLLGKVLSPSEVIKKIEDTSLDDIYMIIDKIFKQSRAAFSIVGRNDISTQLKKFI